MIVQEASSVIRAHYAQGGRNIWAMVSPNGPGSYTLNVADAGMVDLEANLAKACHVALVRRVVRFQQVHLAAGFRRNARTGGEDDGGG